MIAGNTTTFQDASWNCVTNSWNMTDDGWISFPFQKGGYYSLIVNPDANLIPASKLCGFWCDYQQWFYIGGSGVIFIVILVVVLVSCVGPKNQYPVALTKPADWYKNKRTFDAPT
jgi:hypothetical protein